jgi:hypothetical protein
MRIHGPRSNEIFSILLVESHKLDPFPLNGGARPKKWQIKAKFTCHHFGRKINWFQTLDPLMEGFKLEPLIMGGVHLCKVKALG